MARSYRAILNGDRLQWLDTPPVEKQPVEVELIVSNAASSGEKMAAALERLAAKAPLASIPDPALWQKDIRNDRKLPGR